MMKIIGILMLVLTGMFVSAMVDANSPRPRPVIASRTKCLNTKDSNGLLMVDCSQNGLLEVPENLLLDVQSLYLKGNYIGRLANKTFTRYPNIKNLVLSYNKVHTIESKSLESLTELKILDLTHNAVDVVPAGLPKSLKKLYLGGNPLKDMCNVDRAVGLEVLSLRGSDLTAYPKLGLLPSLVELDISENLGITDLSVVQLAATCRLAKLNVTGSTSLFRAGIRGSHCRCRRVIQWADTFKIMLYGVLSCPAPAVADVNGSDDDPKNINCTRTPDAAVAVFKKCMAEWEQRNTPYWAIAAGLLIIIAAVLMASFAYLRRRQKSKEILMPNDILLNSIVCNK